MGKKIGITKVCPNCKYIIVFAANYTGTGKEEGECPKCHMRYTKEISQKTIITLTLLAIIVAMIFYKNKESEAEKFNCSSFKTQPEAQGQYRKSLDRDGDGLACESLPIK